MEASTEQYLLLLQEFDDPVYWEYPTSYAYLAAEERFLVFARDLEQACGIPLNAQTGASIQDASFHGQVFLRGWVIRNWDDPTDTVRLRVSNWGNLATVSDEVRIDPVALARIKDVLRRHSYTYVPPSVLDLPYTGKNPGVTGIETWWIRYFDWV